MLRYYESANAVDIVGGKNKKRNKNIDIFRQRKNISSRAPSKHVDDFEFAVKLASSRGKGNAAKSLKMEANEWKNFVNDCKTMKIKIEKIIQDPEMLKNDDVRVTLAALLEKHTGVAKALELIGVNLGN